MQKPIAIWLLICSAMVFAMVVIGGVTRLTNSGLSMVDWQPIMGAIPPLNQEDWEVLLRKYQETPQYQQVNKGMNIDEFKNIFWWEYFHRLFGRLIGLVFFIPFIYFLVRKKIDRPLGIKLSGIFILGGLQGLMGWYMVMSGLVNDPHVSQYRLTAHLGLAFVIYAALFWVAMDLLFPETSNNKNEADTLKGLRHFSIVLTTIIFIMVLSGGFVAGIRAGLAYNTFPLMNGHIIPPEIFILEPWYRNFFENMATVQFDHRLIAWLLAFLVPIFWVKARTYPIPASIRHASNILLIILVMQISLGIATLLQVVPIHLAASHQAGAILLFTAALWMTHTIFRHTPKTGKL